MILNKQSSLLCKEELILILGKKANFLPFSKCGIAIGGLAVGEEKQAMMDTIEFCTDFLPIDQPRYLMGSWQTNGHNKCRFEEVDMFDCVMPTLNSRNGHIFASK